MEDNTLRMTLLFDIYGALLTPRQQLIFDLYHNEDLSLGEIAENEGVSRQAVSDCLEKARSALEGFETAAGALRLRQAALACAGELEELASRREPEAPALLEISKKLRGVASGL